LIYRFFFKPIFDRVFALILLILFSPILISVSVAILFKMGSPIFFRQLRPTKGEKIFKIFKFRTMSDERDEKGELLPDEVRLGSFGKFIRSTSLDELPQILNVLKGEVSFIGPRPLLPEYLPLYSDYQKQRHNVKAGITGLAQVKGRNNLSWKNRFRYDVFYSKKVSFGLDLKIAILTIQKIVKRSDVNQEGKATMEKFRGNF
jgi:undecaprenyl phosphate N,N'-diacetylbacillosamine 1-phosphate transferase